MNATTNSTSSGKKKRIRPINVYLPSKTMREEFRKYAKERGLNLSKLMQHCVLERMGMEIDDEESVEELKSKIGELEERVHTLEMDVETRDRAISSFREELHEYQQKVKNDEPAPRNKLDKTLVQLLRNSTRQIPADDLPSLLGIEKDSDKMKSIMDNIDELFEVGLLKPHPSGYVWKRVKTK